MHQTEQLPVLSTCADACGDGKLNVKKGKEKIWPIDSRSNVAIDESRTSVQRRVTGLLEETENAALTPEQAFGVPQTVLDALRASVSIEPLQRYDGKGIICAWPTRECPVGCEYCFFDSTMGGGRNTDTQWSTEATDRLIGVLNDANIGELRLSGGGDPFVERETIYRLVEAGKVEEFTLVTSGFWAKSRDKAGSIIDELYTRHSRNPHKPITAMRVSVDGYHLTRLKPDGMQYMTNIVDHYDQNYAGDDRFQLTLHTMVGDNTIDELLSRYPVESREWVCNRIKHGSHRSDGMEVVKLKSGLTMRIRHARIFYSDPEIDMDSAEARHNIESCERDIALLHDGHVGLVYNEGRETGLNFGMYHDGRLLSWGATAPDNEHDIYSDTYADMERRAYGDVVSLSVLEQGDAWARNIVKEANPQAGDRAYAIGLRDFYSRILFEESKTRLYYAIRVLQEYRDMGRISPDDLSAMPQTIRKLMDTPREELIRLHTESPSNIVTQYLDNPAVTTEDLLRLLRLVRNGHYDMTVERMTSIIDSSNVLNPAVRMAFLRQAAPRPAGNEPTGQEVLLGSQTLETAHKHGTA